MSKWSRIAACLAISLCTWWSLPGAQAAVVKDDKPDVSASAPVYWWHDLGAKPKGMAIAIHGLTLHGGSFDTMSCHLAGDGIMVYAPDLRGYGRWMKEGDATGKEARLNYEQSYADLEDLIGALKDRHPDLPLYLIGESLGADMALRAAASKKNSSSIDGLVLSSPAIKHPYFLGPVVENAGAFLANPKRQVDLRPYFDKFSEDPKVVEETRSDPLVRKRLTAWDFLRTCSCLRPALQYARSVPASMPVLIIQGNKDRMVRSNAVVLLLKHMRSSDQTVRWFSNRGHLLLETAYAQPDTLDTVCGWLTQHIDDQNTEATVSGAVPVGMRLE